MPESAPQLQAFRWIDELSPLRTLIVTKDGSLPKSWSRIESALQAVVGGDRDWVRHAPEMWQPTIRTASAQDLESGALTEHFDLALCLEALNEYPAGTGWEILRRIRQHARFIALTLRLGESDSLGWRTADWQRLQPLALERRDRELALLVRGGRLLEELPADQPRIWYLAPNRQICGGIKIIYQHVAILNSLGFAAVVGTRQRINRPAQWFPWNPKELAFCGSLRAHLRPNDVVVIPEYQYRHVSRYRHAGRRLLFAQGPGLVRDVASWDKLGFDGVLTLNVPGAQTSRLHAFLKPKCPLPMFPVTNHYSEDGWGRSTAPRIPGRILCQPRKRPEFVARLLKDFPDMRCVDNIHQFRMAVEYAQADVFVQTGFPEGQPMPPIEAMRSGCVVCGFTGGGGLDVMYNGETAFVAEDGNYEQLAESVRRALQDPRREQIRQAGTQFVQRFSRDFSTGELQKCFGEWLHTLPAARPSSVTTWRANVRGFFGLTPVG